MAARADFGTRDRAPGYHRKEIQEISSEASLRQEATGSPGYNRDVPKSGMSRFFIPTGGQAVGLTCTGEDRELRIALSGEVDHHRARGLMEGIDREIDMRLPSRVALDLGGVTFMDSSGIAVLLRAYKRTAELGGALTVRNVPEQAGKVLRAAGLERLMRFE